MILKTVYQYNFDKIKQVRNVLIKFVDKKDFTEFIYKNSFNSTASLKDYFLIQENFYIILRFKDKVFLTPSMDQKNLNITFFTIRCPNQFLQVNQNYRIKPNE